MVPSEFRSLSILGSSWLWTRASRAVFVVVIGLGMNAQSSAESRLSRPLPSSTCEAFAQADTVFVGKVVASDVTGVIRRHRFDVEERFKGLDVGHVELTSGEAPWFRRPSRSYESHFEVGEQYVVYASGGTLLVAGSRTGTGAERRTDLADLRALRDGRVSLDIAGTLIRMPRGISGISSHKGAKVLAGVKIVARGATTRNEATTDVNGRFILKGLEAGTYRLEPTLSTPYRELYGRGPTVLSSCPVHQNIFVTPSGQAQRRP